MGQAVVPLCRVLTPMHNPKNTPTTDDNWQEYEGGLSSHPIFVKTAINVVIYLIGDWMSQVYMNTRICVDAGRQGGALGWEALIHERACRDVQAGGFRFGGEKGGRWREKKEKHTLSSHTSCARTHDPLCFSP